MITIVKYTAEYGIGVSLILPSEANVRLLNVQMLALVKDMLVVEVIVASRTNRPVDDCATDSMPRECFC